jgi:transcriptional regulator with XRE-family HTH domain
MRTLQKTTETKAFLKEVREKRKILKIPQKVIAHELGVTAAAYTQIEKGATSLKFDLFIFLCKRLDLNANNFFVKNS